ncbi:F0F1 ATP synthase subunit delta [Schaalia hyovaginalis]|uniref:F0F1 ATP synthase subunit delta n=1 Tax=Schaalia hyovaginalis TaxID=29316 RepID=UPI0012B209CA|nr:F0F1 ATP synthase subunit delta [Schaalia hyovaginalis]MST64380.1 F0F1 ATP synthase subunit delta [Schaalia hyovaginalis]
MNAQGGLGGVAYSSNLEDALAVPGAPAMRIAEDFFGLSDLVKTDARLRRALTDPSRSAQEKASLVEALFSATMNEGTVRIVKEMAAGHWSKPESLHDAAEVLGILAVLAAAKREGELATVEGELFELRRFLASHRELRLTLSDMSTGDPHERGDLATRVFASKVSVWTMRLLRRAVGRSRHGRLLANLRRFAQWAAAIESKLLVTVETSAEMTAEQAARLRSLLETRFQREVALSVSVEDGVVGGFRLRADTTAIDASLATRIADMKRALAS